MNAYKKGIRLALTISPQASAMIDDLLKSGLWGVHGRAGVAQELIYRGLRDQLREEAVAEAARAVRARTGGTGR